MKLLKIFLLLFVLFENSLTVASQKHWVGSGSGNGRLWNKTANWSLTQGGAGSAGVPTASDSVFIDGGGNMQVNIPNALCLYFNQSVSSGTKDFSNNSTLTVGSGGMIISGGTLSLATTNIALTVNGDITLIGGTLSMAGASSSLNIGGNWNLVGGTFTATNGNVAFNGTSSQAITGSTTFNNLTVNNSGSGILLNSSIIVAGTLNFVSGNITTGTNVVNIASTGSVARASGQVVGNLSKNVATGATTVIFQVGDATNFTPVTVSFANVTSSGTLTVSTTPGDHPNIGSAAIDANKSVNRYWTLTNGGVVFTTYSATFTFVPGDVDGGANTSNFSVNRYSAPNWTIPTTGTRTATSTQATGLTSFSDFAVGEPKTITITASANGNGTITPSGAVVVNYNTNQSFTITPNANNHTDSVIVDGVNQGVISSYTFTNVTSNHTISAYFSINTFTITASAGANGSISPSGSVVVGYGSNQSFTMTPSTGYHVVNVVVDGSSVGAVASYTFNSVTANHTISASFAIDTLTITASAGANGSISPSGPVSVIYGNNQSFTIAANTHYHITDVLVDGSSVGAVTNYTFTSVAVNHTISASFAIDTLTITASAGANGSIAPSGAVAVTYGSDQKFTVTPNTGYHIQDVVVDGSSVGITASYTFTSVTANHTISASFAIDTLTITASAGANGSISPSGAIALTYGSDQKFTVTANTGYHIQDVVVDGSSVGATASYTFTSIAANHTISASFAIDTLNIKASAGPNGSISPSGAVGVTYGSDQKFTVTANTGYHIQDVIVDGSSVGVTASYTFTSVIASHTISASFAVDTLNIKASAGPNGSISPSGAVAATYGSNQTFTVTPDTGYHVADVLVDGGSVGAVTSYTFTSVAANHTISASFGINMYSIAATAGANGAISPSGKVGANFGDSQKFVITPNTGYHIADVTVDGGSVGPVSSYTFSNIVANHTIDASFAINTYSLAASAGSHGAISPSGKTVVNYGSDQKYTITPDAGYFISDVHVDSATVGAVSSYLFTNVTQNHTIEAFFSIQTFKVTSSTGSGGTLTPLGSTVVNYGDSLQFTIAPDAGHFVADVHVDTVSVGQVTSYTFHNIQANHTIDASFGINSYKIKASASVHGTISPNGSTVVNFGDSLQFTVTPDTGYFIADVNVDSVSVGQVSSYTFHSVQANHTISATFTINTYKITSTAGAHGTISPNGSTVINYGDSLAYTITPDSSYFVSDVHVDGVSVGAVISYTFRNVTAVHLIEAFFAQFNPVPVLKVLNPAGAYRGDSLVVCFIGNNFINGISSVSVGAGVKVNSVTVTNAETLKASITVNISAALGARNFSVINSGPGGGTSTKQTFTVLDHAPSAPALIAPLNRDTVYKDLVGPSLDFIWHRSVDLDAGDSVTYSINLKGPSLDTTLVGLEDTTLSWSIVNLLVIGKTYTWTVNSTDGIAVTASPDTFSFYATQAVGVNDKEHRIPKVYALHQNFPNPFNPTTMVQFDLPHPATVTLVVYNILGQEIATLINKQSMDAGYKSFLFDASTVPTGVYLYRILAEESGGNVFVSVKKMILLK